MSSIQVKVYYRSDGVELITSVDKLSKKQLEDMLVSMGRTSKRTN